MRKYGINHHVSEPNRPQQNQAEAAIRAVKIQWFQLMTKILVSKQLWDFGIVWVCKIMSLTAYTSFALEGQTPIKQVKGKTPDISEYLDFGFYDWVWYKDNTGVGDNMCDGEQQLQDWDEYTDVQDEALNDHFNSAVSDKRYWKPRLTSLPMCSVTPTLLRK